MKLDSNNIVFHTVRIILLFVLIFSFITKLLNVMPLVKTIYILAGFKYEISFLISVCVISIEFFILLFLLLNRKRAYIFSFMLFTAFFIISLYGYVAEIKSSCGCFGSFSKGAFDLRMVIRNLIFLFLSAYLFLFKSKMSKSIT